MVEMHEKRWERTVIHQAVRDDSQNRARRISVLDRSTKAIQMCQSYLFSFVGKSTQYFGVAVRTLEWECWQHHTYWLVFLDRSVNKRQEMQRSLITAILRILS